MALIEVGTYRAPLVRLLVKQVEQAGRRLRGPEASPTCFAFAPPIALTDSPLSFSPRERSPPPTDLLHFLRSGLQPGHPRRGRERRQEIAREKEARLHIGRQRVPKLDLRNRLDQSERMNARPVHEKTHGAAGASGLDDCLPPRTLGDVSRTDPRLRPRLLGCRLQGFSSPADQQDTQSFPGQRDRDHAAETRTRSGHDGEFAADQERWRIGGH